MQMLLQNPSSTRINPFEFGGVFVPLVFECSVPLVSTERFKVETEVRMVRSFVSIALSLSVDWRGVVTSCFSSEARERGWTVVRMSEPRCA